MDNCAFQIQLPCWFWSRKLLFFIGIIASLILVFHTFTLPYRGFSSPALSIVNKEEISSGESVSMESKRMSLFSILNDAYSSTNPNANLMEFESTEISGDNGQAYQIAKNEALAMNFTDLIDDIELDRENLMGFEERENNKNVEEVNQNATASFVFTSQNISNPNPVSSEKLNEEIIVPAKVFLNNNDSMNEDLSENSSSRDAVLSALVISSTGGHEAEFNSTEYRMKGKLFTKSTQLPISDSIHIRQVIPGRLLVSVLEMKQQMRTYHSSNYQKWHLARDKQLLAAKGLIQKCLIAKYDEELFEPAFWNISKFKRSYELMEQMLKIYVYREGNKPIFHQPLLRGIYASEGWLMKLLQADKHFTVRDHRKAHLFYMPFSSRLLQITMYNQSSHSHRNLAQHLKNYVNLIASKYPYWNRTGGADHFAAACHDWAPQITAQAMETTIRALCNADLKRGFKLGKDVSLPEIYIRSARNPLRDLGGKSADNRSTLAFYAGNLHGRLRPIILQHWENKDPDMKILGPMPPGVKSKMIYIQHMKNSKYCICPRGYEVNSPRIVESIYYECVPVIISDYYVPPFFEVLNWDSFSVIIPEGDVPRLKDLLASIPEEKYKQLQLGVRRVQQHFLWHNKPVKYDLFHMTLHSIWYNRLHLEGNN